MAIPTHSHWYLLMGISIARWLAASMWEFLLFLSSLITPIIICYSTYSAISMACAHVLRKGWKGWSPLKSMKQLLGWHRDEHEGYLVLRKGSIQDYMIFVGITFWSIDVLKDMIVCWDALSIIVLMSNDRLFLWITRVLIFMPWLDIWSRLC